MYHVNMYMDSSIRDVESIGDVKKEDLDDVVELVEVKDEGLGPNNPPQPKPIFALNHPRS